ncbi:hypothetical protein C7999DRAFT_32673 [Corynascus novoguineensis]|uniref:Uncharacterized protein n=1 Tax=Corynascus novoguineensis TaxID=1126955 RepID=A0AAN7CRC2_9PEZI|nr:hypothetical protein C7999DRAFT_32673 [Corynascus novoguineensis]
MAAPMLTALSPQQISDNLKSRSQKYQALQETSKNITPRNTPLLADGQGPFPVLIKGLKELAADGIIFFAHVQVELFGIMIQKAESLSRVLFDRRPVGIVPDKVVDLADKPIADLLIDVVQSRAENFRTEADILLEIVALCRRMYHDGQ